MIAITVSGAFDGRIADRYTQMNPLAAEAELRWHSATRAVFLAAAYERFAITGSNLDWGPARNGGYSALLVGEVDALI